MTNLEYSNHFLYGMALLNKYRTDNFSVNVVEHSGIAIEGLKYITAEDKESLELLNWHIFNQDGKDQAVAFYYKLEYVDT